MTGILMFIGAIVYLCAFPLLIILLLITLADSLDIGGWRAGMVALLCYLAIPTLVTSIGEIGAIIVVATAIVILSFRVLRISPRRTRTLMICSGCILAASSAMAISLYGENGILAKPVGTGAVVFLLLSPAILARLAVRSLWAGEYGTASV